LIFFFFSCEAHEVFIYLQLALFTQEPASARGFDRTRMLRAGNTHVDTAATKTAYKWSSVETDRRA